MLALAQLQPGRWRRTSRVVVTNNPRPTAIGDPSQRVNVISVAFASISIPLKLYEMEKRVQLLDN